MSIQPFLTDVESQANPTKAKIFLRFFKTAPGQYGHGDMFLGLTLPIQRRLARDYWRQLTLDDLHQLLHHPVHECRLIALIILIKQYQKGTPDLKKLIYKLYLQHTSRINNWDLVDLSAPNIVGVYLYEQNSRTKLYQLAQSQDIWKNRISIISTLYFIKRGQITDTLAIAKILLSRRHDLIHKAIGWMLREVGKQELSALEHFLVSNYSSIPRTALRYAIEKFPPQKRLYYLHLSKSDSSN
jgi:3-methyladenine DNA glycosylase AlkD